MLPKRTLQQLIEIAHARSDSAARELGATHSREREATGKLKLLLDYRDECLARLVRATREGMDRELWLNYQRFVVKLGAAIEQQREQLAQQRDAVEQSRAQWRSANGRLRSFDALEQRRRQAETADGRRREQREQDAQALRRNRTGR